LAASERSGSLANLSATECALSLACTGKACAHAKAHASNAKRAIALVDSSISQT